MKLIDAEELRRNLFIYAPVAAQSVIGFCIDHTPTKNVTFCKDCKHRAEFEVAGTYPCHLGGYVKLDDFCSRGEEADF